MLIPSGFAQVNLRITGVGVPRGAEMTFGVDNTGAASAVAIAETVEAALIVSGLGGSMFEDAAITNIHVKRGPNATGSFTDHPVNVPGVETGTPVPPNVSVLLKKSTSLGGREGQGRMFHPCVEESQISADGIVGSGLVTDLTTQCSSFLSELDSNGIFMVLLHNSSTVPTAVNTLTPDSLAATQRRRLRS